MSEIIRPVFEEYLKNNNKPLDRINNSKSFEAISAFNESPFGKNWEKRLPKWAEKLFSNARVINKNNINIVDLSNTISHSQVEIYDNIINRKNVKK